MASTDLGVTAPSSGRRTLLPHPFGAPLCCGINRFGCDASVASAREVPAASAWCTVMCCDVNRFGCDTNGNKSKADS